jgi:predicted aspartyl protease
MLKLTSFFAVSLLLAASRLSGQTPAPSPKDADYRDFQGPAGKIIQAVLMDKTGDTVTLLLHSGARTVVPIDKLSPADQVYVQSWTKEKAVFIEKCRSLPISQLLELRGYEAFNFTVDGNHILLNGKVNGVEGKFYIDTGADSSVLHLDFAKKAKCEIGPFVEHAIIGIAGDAPAAEGKIESISFGESTFKGMDITVYDMNLGRPEGHPIQTDGLFGADFMSQLDAVISYPERKIFLHPDNVLEAQKTKEFTSFRLFRTKDNTTFRGKIASKTPTVITLTLQDGKTMQIPIPRLIDDDAKYAMEWTEGAAYFLEYCQSLTLEEVLKLRNYQSFTYEREGNHIYVDGGLNDNPVRYMIDTGAASTCLNFESAKAYGCEFGPLNAEEVFGIGGKAPATSTLIKKLTMGDAILTNRKVLSVDMSKFRPDLDLSYIGIFGADFMRELDAVITYKEKKIFLIQHSMPSAPAPAKK